MILTERNLKNTIKKTIEYKPYYDFHAMYKIKSVKRFFRKPITVLEIYTSRPGLLIGYHGETVYNLKKVLLEEFDISDVRIFETVNLF